MSECKSTIKQLDMQLGEKNLAMLSVYSQSTAWQVKEMSQQ